MKIHSQNWVVIYGSEIRQRSWYPEVSESLEKTWILGGADVWDLNGLGGNTNRANYMINR